MDKNVLRKISYGMYVVSSMSHAKFNAYIGNTVFQITSDPMQIEICVSKDNLTHEYIKTSGLFSVSVLEKDSPMSFIGNFGFYSGRDKDKFKNIKYKLGKTGVPVVIEYALGYFECKVVGSMDAGTHSAFIGEIIEAETLKDGDPMTYDYYRRVKGGRSPKNAPTYIVPEKEAVEEEKTMGKYECTVCGYIYDPEIGDPDSDIEPGTAFADIPADWVCPLCGVGKDMFSAVE